MNALVVVEHRNGVAIQSYREAVAAARGLGGSVTALVVGANAPEVAAALGGVDDVVAVRTPAAEHEVEREVAAVVAVARERAADAVVCLSTATALGWAGAVAIGLGAGYAADVVELSAVGDGLLASTGLYGGKVVMDVKLPRGSVVLVRPATFAPADATGTPPVEVVDRDDRSRATHVGFRDKPPAGASTSRRPTSCWRSAAASATRTTSPSSSASQRRWGRRSRSRGRSSTPAGWPTAGRSASRARRSRRRSTSPSASPVPSSTCRA